MGASDSTPNGRDLDFKAAGQGVKALSSIFRTSSHPPASGRSSKQPTAAPQCHPMPAHPVPRSTSMPLQHKASGEARAVVTASPSTVARGTPPQAPRPAPTRSYEAASSSGSSVGGPCTSTAASQSASHTPGTPSSSGSSATGPGVSSRTAPASPGAPSPDAPPLTASAGGRPAAVLPPHDPSPSTHPRTAPGTLLAVSGVPCDGRPSPTMPASLQAYTGAGGADSSAAVSPPAFPAASPRLPQTPALSHQPPAAPGRPSTRTDPPGGLPQGATSNAPPQTASGSATAGAPPATGPAPSQPPQVALHPLLWAPSSPPLHAEASTQTAAAAVAVPVATAEDDGLECLICCEVPLDPVVTPCGHITCLACLAAWHRKCVRDSQVLTCPSCRTELRDVPLSVCTTLQVLLERTHGSVLAQRRRDLPSSSAGLADSLQLQDAGWRTSQRGFLARQEVVSYLLHVWLPAAGAGAIPMSTRRLLAEAMEQHVLDGAHTYACFADIASLPSRAEAAWASINCAPGGGGSGGMTDVSGGGGVPALQSALSAPASLRL